jgi:hypothetical protein
VVSHKTAAEPHKVLRRGRSSARSVVVSTSPGRAAPLDLKALPMHPDLDALDVAKEENRLPKLCLWS